MPPAKQTSVKVSPATAADLQRLKVDLRGTYGTKASREDIVGAMAHGVSQHQLVGMLSEYLKHDESDPGSSDDESGA